MSDLIGRFLSFDELLGRGLVKFAYFITLFYLVVAHLFYLVTHLFALEIGEMLLVPFQFLFWVLAVRLIAEMLMAILSIDDRLQGVTVSNDGFEAGLTPDKHQRHPAEPKEPEPDPLEEPVDQASNDDSETDAPKGE